MSAEGTYTCQGKGCGKACKAGVTDVLALLNLCRECAAKRYRAGMRAQQESLRTGSATTGEQ